MSNLMLAPSKGSSDEVSHAISQTLVRLGKIIFLAFLISLFILSFVVWLWVISFRSGWRLWTWVKEKNNEQISVGLFYGLTVLLISPFLLFVDWAQQHFDKALPDWMRLPAQVPVRQLFEQRLGITLGDEFPFFREAEKDTQESL